MHHLFLFIQEETSLLVTHETVFGNSQSVTSLWGMRNLRADTTSWIIPVAHKKDQQEHSTYPFNHAFRRDHNGYLCLGEVKSGHTLQQDKILIEEPFHTRSLSWEKRAWLFLPTFTARTFPLMALSLTASPSHQVLLQIWSSYYSTCIRRLKGNYFFLKVSLHQNQWFLVKGKSEGIFREQCMWIDLSQPKGL